MSQRKEDLEAAGALLKSLEGNSRRLAILTTVSPSGKPHATWMGAAASGDHREILTITSPDSEKVRNIRAHPEVEWLLSGSDRKTLLYLNGRAEIVDDVAEIKKLWKLVPDKEQTFFLKYFNSGMGFAIVRTRIKSIVFVVPEEFRKVEFSLKEFD